MPNIADASSMDLEHQELARLLGELADALGQEGEPFWLNRVQESRLMLLQGDDRGVGHFLAIFGGMGSFNDSSSKRSSHFANQAWELARQIQSRRTFVQSLRLMSRNDAVWAICGLTIVLLLTYAMLVGPITAALRGF